MLWVSQKIVGGIIHELGHLCWKEKFGRLKSITADEHSWLCLIAPLVYCQSVLFPVTLSVNVNYEYFNSSGLLVSRIISLKCVYCVHQYCRCNFVYRKCLLSWENITYIFTQSMFSVTNDISARYFDYLSVLILASMVPYCFLWAKGVSWT